MDAPHSDPGRKRIDGWFWKGLGWTLRACFVSFAFACMMAGLFFVVLTALGALPMTARAVLSHPIVVHHWSVVFWVLMAGYLMFSGIQKGLLRISRSDSQEDEKLAPWLSGGLAIALSLLYMILHAA